MKIQTRSTKVHRTTKITNHALTYLADEMKETEKYSVVNSFNNVVMIQISSEASHIIKLNESTCTCLNFQDKKISCRHAIRACRKFNLKSEIYVNQIYKMSTYRSTYETFMSFIRIEDLIFSSDCLTSLISRRSDRLKAKRQKRKQKKNARINRCTFCKSRNHNRRKCDQDTQLEERLRDSSDSDDDDDDDDSKNSFILNKITENDDYDFSTNDDFINDFAAFLDLFTSEDVTSNFADFSDISANVIESSFADFSDFLTNENARIFDSKIDEENERNKDINDVKNTRQINSFAKDM